MAGNFQQPGKAVIRLSGSRHASVLAGCGWDADRQFLQTKLRKLPFDFQPIPLDVDTNVVHQDPDEFTRGQISISNLSDHASAVGWGIASNWLFQQSHLVGDVDRTRARFSSDANGTTANAMGRRAIDRPVRECAFT